MAVEVKVMGSVGAGGAAFLNHSLWVSVGASPAVGGRGITAQQRAPEMCVD